MELIAHALWTCEHFHWHHWAVIVLVAAGGGMLMGAGMAAILHEGINERHRSKETSTGS